MRTQGHNPRKLDKVARSKLEAARLARQAAAEECSQPAHDGDTLACGHCNGSQGEKGKVNGVADERDGAIGPAGESVGHGNSGTTKQSESLAPEWECEQMAVERSGSPVHQDGIVGR